MQIISTVTKVLPADDPFANKAIAHHMEVPSLLHVMDKTDLTKYIIQKNEEDEKNEGYLERLVVTGATKYKT
jgi:hypothetical protein